MQQNADDSRPSVYRTAIDAIAALALTALACCSGVSAAQAAPAIATGMDCPLARQPYSSRTPLIDLILNPATRAIVERDMNGVLAKLPPAFGPTPPTFAAIITPNELAGMAGLPDADVHMAKLDADLKSVPLTTQAIRTRCARYDQTPPALPARIPHPALLVFEKINGFKDVPGFTAAHAALSAMAQKRGWTLIFSENGAIFNPSDLARFDAVIWNNVSGDVLTIPQENAFKTYLAAGGGFVGIHGAGGDPFYAWDWYSKTLLGEAFAGHPMNPQFQTARVRIDDPNSAITRGLGNGWSMTEEWYSFKNDPRDNGAHILATLDEATYSPVTMGGKSIRMGDHPIAWTRCIGNGRSFYTAIGHRPESYAEPHSMALLESGITWAAGLGETRCADDKEVTP